MAQDVMSVKFDEAKMIRKLGHFAKDVGETQRQAIKRWGVQTCRELARMTEPFGSTKKKAGSKLMSAMWSDALNVIYTVERKRKSGSNSYQVTLQGNTWNVPQYRFLTRPEEVISWIDSNRSKRRGRTRRLATEEKRVCLESTLKRAITLKFKRWGGLAKDSWIDAGNDISRGQRGPKQTKISPAYIKWAQKPQKVGTSKEGRKMMKEMAELISRVSYLNNYLLKSTNKRKAIQIGLNKTISTYKAILRWKRKNAR